MLTTTIAVLGTLAGALMTGTLAHLSQRAQRRHADTAARRDAALVAVTELVTALADHRRTMWAREDLRLRGEDWREARANSHTTRSALTAPLLRVRLLVPALAPVAQTAAEAVYALRDVETEPGLRAAREHALATADDVVTAAAAAFAA